MLTYIAVLELKLIFPKKKPPPPVYSLFSILSVIMAREDLFYQPPKGEKSGLPYDPFKSFVIPRPIGWISTRSKDGVDNLAPYSQFTNVSFDPPTILFVYILFYV